MKRNISNIYFFLFVGFLFLGLVGNNLFSDGMFLDGLLYADISRNLAMGLGSFWHPHLSNTLFPQFYEHPPLALGLQAIWFKIFGDSIYVERIYSLSTFIITGYVVVLIWKQLTNEKQTAWIPLLLLLTFDGIIWCTTNNMLENTMTIFTCFSVFSYLKSYKNKHKIIWAITAGISLSLGLLTKGFFCLYIWGLPFFMWLFERKEKFVKMFLDTAIIIGSTVLPIALLYFFVPDAQINMTNYFNKQVIGSIENVVTVGSRFQIIKMFIQASIIPIIIAAIVIIIYIKKHKEKKLLTKNLKSFLTFFTLTISGVLPIMISLKQRSFYILTVYPFFAIAIAYYIYPIIKPEIKKFYEKKRTFKAFKIITFVVILSSVTLSLMQINRIGRDEQTISECKKIINAIGKNETINICENMYSNWNLHGYFSRYGNISLNSTQKDTCKYYISADNCNKEYLDKYYKIVPLETRKYKLYRRKKM